MEVLAAEAVEAASEDEVEALEAAAVAASVADEAEASEAEVVVAAAVSAVVEAAVDLLAADNQHHHHLLLPIENLFKIKPNKQKRARKDHQDIFSFKSERKTLKPLNQRHSD